MGYALAQDCHFCISGGRAVIIDVRRDTFFALPHVLERAFSQARLGEELGEQGVAALQYLCRKQILKMNEEPTDLQPSRLPHPPSRSFADVGEPRWKARDIPLCVIRLAIARHVLARHGLAKAVDKIRALKAPLATPPVTGESHALIEAIASFHLLSDWGGSYNLCLRRSFALAFHLVKSGVAVQLVIGVMMRPFAAHCWVQLGDLVLNDRVEVVRDYTPLLIV